MIQDGLLDTSNYDVRHEYYSKQYAAKLGCIKDEFKGKVCKEIVMLAPKCYSMQIVGERKPKVAAKGIGKEVSSNLTHEDYRDRIIFQNELNKKVRRIQSFKHQLYNITQNKIALSFTENKRAWISDNQSLPYGHYLL